MSQAPALLARLPLEGTLAADDALERFVDWIADTGLSPYPAQEEAMLELASGKHVILSTPTGSGKSLVALYLHFRAMAAGARSFYTAPTKALVSEKFFALCDLFGADAVGMLTGDASINPEADILCCTQEVLASMALRSGEALDAPYAVLDEFHYYGDRERGAAWQIPLLALPRTTFLLMSATLGNMAPIAERLERRTARAVADIHSDERPVPLEFSYRETPLHETVETLLAEARAPVYVVNFTQRECGEQAQALTSAKIADRELRERIGKALGGFRFDTSYGADLARFVRAGIGVHHAGLLPRYRLLVEKLAQQGLLRVICGTDTLGVGVNIPIRTVLFTKLSKFDGEKVGILGAREFRQIAGRAGRKGFDERGWVVCQAPEHVIERRRAEAKFAEGRKNKVQAKKAPPGFVGWTRETFEQLQHRVPDALESRFAVDHGLLLAVLQRDPAAPTSSGYRALAELIELSHGDARGKRRLLREAARVFRSLRRAGILVLERGPDGRSRVAVHADLQREFSLYHTLSLYLVDAVAALDATQPGYALEVLTTTEAILEDPRAILFAQLDRAKGELIARLKAEGVDYEGRIRKLDEATWPRPSADFLHATYAIFAEKHPWLAEQEVRPKSIAREMVERYLDFAAYVRELGVARSEGVLLRYLSDVHNTLARNVPESAKTPEVYDVLAYLRTLVARVDSSMLEAWERLLAPGEPEREAGPVGAPPPRAFDLAEHPKALHARIRAELHALVRALAARDYAEAAASVLHEGDDAWPPPRFEQALAPYFAEYGEIVFTPAARALHRTVVRPAGPRAWDATQVIVDPRGDEQWCVRARVELPRGPLPEGPLVRVVDVGI